MNAALTMAGKDLRLILRDPRSVIILLLMPLLLILVLGLSVGQLFGQKQDDRIRISVCVLDAGLPEEKLPLPDPEKSKRWADIVLADLTDTANIKIELIPDRATANRLVENGDRSAVVILEAEFSDRVHRCSFTGEPFTKEPINPLYRDGMRTKEIGVTILRNPTQTVAGSIIEQVMQVTLLRVVIPWMIGNAFEMIGTDEFMNRLETHIPALKLAYAVISRKEIGNGIQKGISAFFNEYRFTAKTWAGLTNNKAPEHKTSNEIKYSTSGEGLSGLKRGAILYQTLVPSYIVTFAFFLVLTVGWLFIAERKNGTINRLRGAPISKFEILLGKMIPAFAISLVQGFFLLICGKLIFGMAWGPAFWMLPLLVLCTSFAAVGLSMLVAGIARNETQVAVYGTLLVLLLAGISGSLMPRDLMPDQMKKISLITPHAWALNGYAELLTNPNPNVMAVFIACGVLAGFGVLFTILALMFMKLD